MTTTQITAGEYGEKTVLYYWNTVSLALEIATVPTVGLGGGGAATLADGADVTQGAKADLAWDGSALAPTAQGILKYLGAKLEAVRALLAGTLTTSVSNFPATQPVGGTVAVSNMIPAVETGLAKESGGNLATLATASGVQATATNQATANASLAAIVAAEGTGNGSLALLVTLAMTQQADLLTGIYRELRINNELLQAGLNVPGDLDFQYRTDPSYLQ